MKNSKTQMIKLSKVAISLSLFSTLMMPMVVYADKVENLGVATGDNSVAVGQDSIATSTNGIATGHQSVATGGGLTRDEFNTRKQQYDATIQNINTENANIKQKNQEISDKDTEIDVISNTLNNYRNQKPAIDAKKRTYDDLVNQRDAKRDDVNNKTTEVTNAQNALDPFRKNGSSDKYVSFFDFLGNLDWQISKTDDDLANELKTQIDSKFGNTFSQFAAPDYKPIIEGYKKREGQIVGSMRRLTEELGEGYAVDKEALVYSYYNNSKNNTTYVHELNNADKFKFVHTSTEGGLGDYDMTSPSFSSDYKGKKIDGLLSPESRNTLVLASASKTKLQKENKFDPILSGRIPYAHIDVNSENLDSNFYAEYRKRKYAFENDVGYHNRIVFGFKGVDNKNKALNPIKNDDLLLNIVSSIISSDVENPENFVNTEPGILTKYIKDYKDSIDWNHTESAIDLNDYKTKLDKVEAFYTKIDTFLTKYKEIIDARSQPNADENELNNKSKEILALKKGILDEHSNLDNYLAGIDIVYTDKALEYLTYGKAEADEIIKAANRELRLYDPNEGVIKAVDDKIEALKTEYETAKREKDEAERALNYLNNQVNAKELTPEEKAIDKTISDKESKKQALEEEKARLEKEKQDAQDRLDAARDALSKSNIANLGRNSYAHGFQAFASGDNSIAIGTQALAKGEDSIAMGRESQANAQDSIAMGRESQANAQDSIAIGRKSIVADRATNGVAIGNGSTVKDGAINGVAIGNGSTVKDGAINGVAIGQGAEVKHENSVAIGKGSRTEVGALAPNYKATLSDDRKASFEFGSIGEFSVGHNGGLRQITHVAAGVKDTDAVNVWQLKAAIAAIPRADNNNTGGQPAQPSQPAQPVNVQVYDVSGNNETQVTSLETAINRMNEQGIKYVHVNGATQGTEPQDRSNGDSSASGVYAVAIGHLANAVGANSVALGDKAESRADNSVALGADSQTTAEKTENTLGVGNQRDRDIIDNLNNTVNNYAGNAVGVVSVGQKGKERIIQNVAAGLVGANSTDAVNGSQLHALAQAVGRGETGLVRQGTDANGVVNGVNHNRLTVGSATGGSEVNFANVGGQARRLTGVAEGIEATDAVNKSQLDKAIGQLSSRFEKTEKQLKGGISNVAAMASLPQAYLPSQGMLSVATGYYRGSSSVAIGLSQVSDNGRVVFKLNGSASQKGDFTAGAGIGFAW